MRRLLRTMLIIVLLLVGAAILSVGALIVYYVHGNLAFADFTRFETEEDVYQFLESNLLTNHATSTEVTNFLSGQGITNCLRIGFSGGQYQEFECRVLAPLDVERKSDTWFRQLIYQAALPNYYEITLYFTADSVDEVYVRLKRPT